MPSLKVLMFGWEWPPFNSGGLGTACEGLTKALLRCGAEIIFVLPKKMPIAGNGARLVFAEIEKLLVKPVPALLYPYVTAGAYQKELAALGFRSQIYGLNLIEETLAYAKRAAFIVGQEQFDLIHAHDWLSFPAGLMAKKISGRPLVVHVHATEFDRTGFNGVNSDVYFIEKQGMEQADKVITVSQRTKEVVMQRYHIPAEKISVVHNGIEPKTINATEVHTGLLYRFKKQGNKIVLFVGRITLQKGPDYFVRVAQKVLALEPKVYFVIVGSGDMLPQIIQQAAAAGLSDRIIFTGFLRGEELDQIYRAADLYVLPSVSEPFGITPLEALQNGTPVLVSKQSGVAEVLRSALKVDFWDVDEMVNKIVATLRYPPLKTALALHGEQEVQKITWLDAATKTLSVYKSLLPV